MNLGGRVLSSKEWMLQVFRYYARFSAINRTCQFGYKTITPLLWFRPR